MRVISETQNRVHNITNILPNGSFTTSETERDFY